MSGMEQDGMDPDNIQTEELESLQAIYCKPDEFICWKAPEGRNVTIHCDVSLPNREDAQRGRIDALLPCDYPLVPPREMRVVCDGAAPSTLHSITLEMKERAESLKGEPMLLNLVSLVQELLETSTVIKEDDIASDCDTNSEDVDSRLKCTSIPKTSDSDYLTHNSSVSVTQNHHQYKQKPCSGEKEPDNSFESNSNIKKENGVVTALLQLDHMRSRQHYVKLIQKWTAELGLKGRLLFYGKFIFIVLQGESQRVKDYIVRNKTMIVDVDSKGRPCKERMLSVLCEQSSQDFIRLEEFVVMDSIASLEELASIFQSFSMEDMFKGFLEPICSVRSKKSSSRK